MSSSGFQRPGTRSSGRAFGISLSVDSAVSASGQAAAIDAASKPLSTLTTHRHPSTAAVSSAVAAAKNQLLFLVERHAVVVVQGEPNGGKADKIPLFLLEAGWAGAVSGAAATEAQRQQQRSVVVALPTPSAAVAASARASAAVGSSFPPSSSSSRSPSSSSSSAALPPVVGYSIPFEDVSAEGVTRLTFCDFASLLTEMGDDPLLSRRAAVVVGGASTRRLAGDLVLSLLRRVSRRRPDLRVVVTCSDVSAAESVARFFGWKGGKEGKRGGGAAAAAAVAAAAAAAAAAAPPSSSSAPSSALPPPSPIPAVLQLPRSLHPVRIQYLAEPAPNYLEAAAEAIVEALRRSDGGGGGRATPSSSGDILFFVPGASEAVAAAEAILEAARSAQEEEEESEEDEDDYLNDARGGKKRGRGKQQQEQQRLGQRQRQQPLPSVLRLHSGAPASHASAALSPPPRAAAAAAPLSSSSLSSSTARRVIVATDEGVAGLSLPAVGVVVDSLLQRRTRGGDGGGGGGGACSSSWSSSGLRVEETVPCSGLLAAARAARAGVARPGLCLRLSAREDFEEAAASLAGAGPGGASSSAGGDRFDLASACLRLKAFGVDNLRSHEWGPSFLEQAAWKEGAAKEEDARRRRGGEAGSRRKEKVAPLYSDPLPPARPPAAALARALETLHSLGALDDRGRLTGRGRLLAELPPTLDPRWGASLLSAALDSDDPAPLSTGNGDGRDGKRKRVGPRAAADVATIAAFSSLRPVWLPPFAVKAALEGGDGGDESGDDDEEERQRKAQLGGAALSAELRLKFAAAEGDPVTALNVWRAWHRVGSKARGPRASSRWCLRHGLDLRVLLRAADVRRQLLRHLARLGVRTSDDGGDGGDGDGRSDVSAVVRALARGFFASAAVSVGPAPPEPGVGGGIGGGGGGGGAGSAGAGVGVGGGGRRAAQTATGDSGGWPAFDLLSSSSSSSSSFSSSSPSPLLRIAPPSVLSASFAGALGLELPTPKAILFFEASVSDSFAGGGGRNGRQQQQQQRPRRDRPVAEVRSALAIDPGLLLEVAPHFYERGSGGGGVGGGKRG